MWVKICGTTNLHDAQLAIDAGADALGFIFAPSKRHVTVGQVAPITALLPSGVDKVGIVAESDAQSIIGIVRAAGLTAVQLHLPHNPALTAELRTTLGDGVRLIQVLPIDADLQDNSSVADYVVRPLEQALADQALWAVLLDTAKAGVSGGTGIAFAWKQVVPAIRAAESAVQGAGLKPARLLLAGGLHPGNLREAIATVQPWGVDVCSGLEESPGHKDPDRLRAFLQIAHEAAESAAAF